MRLQPVFRIPLIDFILGLKLEMLGSSPSNEIHLYHSQPELYDTIARSLGISMTMFGKTLDHTVAKSILVMTTVRQIDHKCHVSYDLWFD